MFGKERLSELRRMHGGTNREASVTILALIDEIYRVSAERDALMEEEKVEKAKHRSFTLTKSTQP